MNSPFGQFSDDSTQAFNEAMAERFDFKQCQRSDGTIYGVPDKSNCAQKGAKEVKPNKGGEGGGSANSKEIEQMTSSKGGGQAGLSQKRTKVKKKFSTLGTHALRDVIAKVFPGKETKKLFNDELELFGLAGMNKAAAKMVIEEAYKAFAKIQTNEGKKPLSITSLMSGEKL